MKLFYVASTIESEDGPESPFVKTFATPSERIAWVRKFIDEAWGDPHLNAVKDDNEFILECDASDAQDWIWFGEIEVPE